MSADSFFVGCVFLIGIVAVKISFLKIMKTARKSSGLRLQSLRPHMLVGEDGFEPSKRNAADLQSVPFGHSGTPPYEIQSSLALVQLEPVDGLEPPTY